MFSRDYTKFLNNLQTINTNAPVLTKTPLKPTKFLGAPPPARSFSLFNLDFFSQLESIPQKALRYCSNRSRSLSVKLSPSFVRRQRMSSISVAHSSRHR